MSVTGATQNERLRREVYRKLEDRISEMNCTVDAVVVEGLHDKKTLRLLGYNRPILLCSKISNVDLTDLTAKKFSNVAILTDFDEQGRTLNKRLTSLFEQRGLKVARFYRESFQKLLKEAKVATIKGIYRIKLDLFS